MINEDEKIDRVMELIPTLEPDLDKVATSIEDNLDELIGDEEAEYHKQRLERYQIQKTRETAKQRQYREWKSQKNKELKAFLESSFNIVPKISKTQKVFIAIFANDVVRWFIRLVPLYLLRAIVAEAEMEYNNKVAARVRPYFADFMRQQTKLEAERAAETHDELAMEHSVLAVGAGEPIMPIIATPDEGPVVREFTEEDYIKSHGVLVHPMETSEK